jgi:REP element-mobilizing transposase RayT
MSRGNEGSEIVRDDHDRKVFLDLLGKMCKRHKVEIYTYVLMDNHYHLLLKTPLGNLSKSMQWFAQTYTRQYNLRHRRSGHLFQGRFKSFLVEDDSYLIDLSCYIHRNPLRAGMVNRLIDHKWSSYSAYAYGKKKEEWLCTDLILSYYSRKKRNEEYRRQVQAYAKEEKKIWEDVRYGLFMGSREYIENMSQRFLEKQDCDKEMPQQKKVLKTEVFKKKIWNAAEALGFEIEAVRKRGRVREEQKEGRDILLYLLWESGIYTNKEIGTMFGLSYSAVSRRAGLLRPRLLKELKLKKKYNMASALIKI